MRPTFTESIPSVDYGPQGLDLNEGLDELDEIVPDKSEAPKQRCRHSSFMCAQLVHGTRLRLLAAQLTNSC